MRAPNEWDAAIGCAGAAIILGAFWIALALLSWWVVTR